MRQVMIDEAKTRLACTEQPAVRSSPRFLMPHAEKMARGIEDVHIGERPSVRCVKFQVVAINGAGRLPAETYFVYLCCCDSCKIEAGLDGEFREACIVLDTRDALFRDREEQLAVAHDAGGGIVHL